jgi:hypothetical protein
MKKGIIILLLSLLMIPLQAQRWSERGSFSITLDNDTTITLVNDLKKYQGANCTYGIEVIWTTLDATTAYVFPTHGIERSDIRMDIDSVQLSPVTGACVIEGTYLSTGKLCVTIHKGTVSSGTVRCNWYLKKE